ncbi:hypothetical protein BDV97DRAFT_366765 [Delphinella strobiligena]|nr:hypothetical protein BDV97DRAFT_366765 [Delphinella strobiligena]
MATQTKKLYLAGVGVSHSVAKPMHNAIAKGLGLPWEFELLDCPTVEYMIDVFRQPDFAGGVVTMPYKKEVMSHLDGIDTLAIELGACNNVYLDSEKKLRGTNTDWRGIKGSLLGVSDEGRGKPALIVGAGGAARAAVYALYKHLDCTTIYVINRDSQEVVDLCKDAEVYQTADDAALNIVHVTSTEQVSGLGPVYYIVGTVPDFEPQSKEEKLARSLFEGFLTKNGPKGVIQDMCYKPRWTRNRKLAQQYGGRQWTVSR